MTPGQAHEHTAWRRRVKGPRHPHRRLAVAVLVSAVALSLTVFLGSSDAQMTSSKKNPGNLFSAGTMSLTNSKSGRAVINAAGLLPGSSSVGTLSLTAAGTYNIGVTLTNGGVSDQPSSPSLSGALTLTVEDVTGSAQTLWSGTMSAFSSVSLGQLAPTGTRTYRFTVAFPSANVVPGLVGASTSMTLQFTGVAQ